MKAARVRISRVKMKAGGADVRVLQRDPQPRIVRSAADFVNEIASYDGPPSAFVAVAFWPSNGEPWRPPQIVRWDTNDADLPLSRLTQVAASVIAGHGIEERAVDRVMRRLGYIRDDDPDPVA